MTNEELDILWFKAMRQSVEEDKAFIRYHFAALVAAEKDKEIERLQDLLYTQLGELTALRAEKQMRGHIKELQEQPR